MNSKYYFGLAWNLRKYEEEDEVALSEVEQSLRAAIFKSPSHWVYRLNLAEFYLRQQKRSSATYYIPMALREFAAAVRLFPESLPLQNRLGSILMWAGNYHPELIPLELF